MTIRCVNEFKSYIPEDFLEYYDDLENWLVAEANDSSNEKSNVSQKKYNELYIRSLVEIVSKEIKVPLFMFLSIVLLLKDTFS